MIETAVDRATLPVDAIQIDREYYRPISEMRVKRMAETGWDETAAGTLTVARRPDGSLFLLDGQHRLAVARACGVEHVNVFIQDVTTREQEAHEYERLGSARSNLLPVERFRAQLVRGYPPAMEINSTLREAGFYVAYTPTNDPRAISAVRALFVVYEHVGKKGLRTVLDILSSSWNGADPNGVILKALGRFIWLHPEADIERLKDKLLETDPFNLRRMARRVSDEVGAGGIVVDHYRALVRLYNQGLRRHKMFPQEARREPPIPEDVARVVLQEWESLRDNPDSRYILAEKFNLSLRAVERIITGKVFPSIERPLSDRVADDVHLSDLVQAGQ